MAHDLFERFFSISKDLLVVTNGKGRIERANHRWEEVLGYPVDEAQGQDIWRYIHPEDLDIVRAARERLYSEGNVDPVEFECRSAHRDGTLLLFAWKGAVDPETGYYYGTAKNITEQRKVEIELAKNRQLLDAFLAYSPNIIHVKGPDGRYLLVNSKFESDLRHLGTGFVGKNIEEVAPPGLAAKIRQNDQEIHKSRRAKIFEEQMIHPDGLHTYLSSKFPIFDDAGEVVGIGGISTDISNLVHEREQASILRKMVEKSADGFGYCDSAFKPLYLNRFLTETLGWSLSDPSLFHYLASGTPTRIQEEILSRSFFQGQSWEGEVDFLNAKTGETHPCWLKIFGSNSEDGKIGYIGFTAADLKNKKIAEAALLHNSKMASLGEMAAGVAHEVNNPITIIHGTASLLKKSISTQDLPKEKIVAALDRIERTSLRISRIVKGLRTFSRSGQNDPAIPTPLSEIFADTVDLCQERFKNHWIDLVIDPVPEISLRCRPTQITQVLLNLLNNAADSVAKSEEKWIHIRFKFPKKKLLRIEISDSGPEISPNVRKRLMEPFFTTKEPGRGTGLGLPISRGIIEEHDGSLFLESTAPHTCFVIELPLS